MNPPPPLVIRAVAAGDYDRWLPLWLGYQAFYREEIPLAATASSWERMLDPAEPVFGALACAGDAAVGLVHFLFHRSTWSVEDSCYLQDLFVAPARRGGGVGRALIEHVYAAARAAGSARVYWLTHETNAPARRLYDTLADCAGFVEYGKTL
jgi:GNAT superfamily N-acetyltransferase